MKVFISSAISGFEAFRDAAAAAIRTLGYEVIRAEDFAASSRSPQIVCLDGVHQADLVVLILGQRHGARQPSGKSATQEEYEEARSKKPVLVFVQEGVTLEPDQDAFRLELERWQGGNLSRRFTTPAQLSEQVTKAVHRHVVTLSHGTVNEGEMVQRALAFLPRAGRSNSPSLMLALAGGPEQQILRPKELAAPSLVDWLHQTARFGEHAIFDRWAAASPASKGDKMGIEQGRGRAVALDELGSIVIEVPVHDDERGSICLVEEDLAERADLCLRFANQLLAHVDPTERITHVAVVAALFDAGHLGWRTREEHRRQPNSGPMGMADKKIVGILRPPTRARERLRNEPKNIAEDLVLMLRREHSPRRG